MVKSQPMNNWAVIKTGGKQYKVAEGDEVVVEKVNTKEDTPILFDEVLLVVDEGKLTIGTPLVNKVKVRGKVLSTFKDKKVRVVKFKPKSKYTRTRGHRQEKTKVLIEKIQLYFPTKTHSILKDNSSY